MNTVKHSAVTKWDSQEFVDHKRLQKIQLQISELDMNDIVALLMAGWAYLKELLICILDVLSLLGHLWGG